MRYVMVLACLALGIVPGCHLCTATVPANLYEGYWVVMFTVAPGCTACEDSMAWLGKAADAYSEVEVLVVCPWSTAELETVTAELNMSIAVDKGGKFGADLTVERAPTVVTLLDREVVTRLDWPFEEADLLGAVKELVGTSRIGPWMHLGENISFGNAITTDGAVVRIDARTGPWLLSFLSLDCPVCQRVLPTLAEVSADVGVLLVVSVSGELSASDEAVLGASGLPLVIDSDQSLVGLLDVRVTPTFVLVGQEGEIIWIREGLLDSEEFHAGILEVLAEASPDDAE